MKRTLFIFSAVLLMLLGCTKVEPVRTKGIDTIESTIYQSSATYYVNGFSFSLAKQVSNITSPRPDISLIVDSYSSPARLTLQTDNFKPSFFKIGDYADEASAIAAFDDLLSVVNPQWTEMADPVTDNQVWVYRTGSEKFVKFRIVSTVNEIRSTIPYGECTFQWLYQPDGSAIFPD